MTIPASHFKALGDPTRLRLASLLAQRGPGICVCDLVEVLQLPQSTISRQIAPLRALGLVRARRAGTWMLYALEEGEGRFARAWRACLDAAAGESPELRADIERFDQLRDRRQLASCCRPDLQAARTEAEAGCCGAPAAGESAGKGNS